ncbi:hypothetical protein [Pseudoduganella sp. R-34]|uniref:hypothetical protein n=1 Tax=unclassified Pseudoduganella TaxID=2637179 RepID=UPI003CF05490
MDQREEGVMRAFRESAPDEAGLVQRTWVNHFAWTLVVLLSGLVFWLVVAVVNAENQRNALANMQCRDRVFKEEIDRQCMLSVQSREHWWQHLVYAMKHTKPQK